MNTLTQRIALGSAQFGLNYGATNKQGKVKHGELLRILTRAHEVGIDLIDTASAYGDSQVNLSLALKELGLCEKFGIVTKVQLWRDGKFSDDASKAVQFSSELFPGKLYGLLIHDADSIPQQEMSHAIELLKSWKEQFGISKIGVSTYCPDTLKLWTSAGKIDMAQVPANVFNQTFKSVISQLPGIEFHARSLYLQGVLLTPNPPKYFLKFAREFRLFEEILNHSGLTRLDFLLSFGLSQERLGRLVIGVTTVSELDDLFSSLNSESKPIDFSQLASNDPGLLNPSLWPSDLDMA